MSKINTFISKLSQEDEQQMQENKLFKQSFLTIPSFMTKSLYWSSFATVFFSFVQRFTLTQLQICEAVIFMAVEPNGQCIIWHLFYWHVLRLKEEEFCIGVKDNGSLYGFLCMILIKVINR